MTNTTDIPQPFSPRKAWLLCGLIIAGFCIQLVIGRGGILMSRQLWMDEIHSIELIEDAELPRSLQALQAGADYNPPGYYLAARMFCRVTGETSVRHLRGFSLLCIAMGLAGIVFGLRHSFPSLVVLLGVLALVGQRLLVDQAFEIRFYALWFALIVWFAVLFDAAVRHGEFTFARGMATGLLAAAISSVHYFGIISVWIVGGVFFFTRADFRKRVSFWIPCVVSLLTLAVCFPFYQGQREALTVATWVSAPTFDHALRFFSAIVPWFVLLILSGTGWLDRKNRPQKYPCSFAKLLREQRGLLSLTLLTIALVVFSFVVQPALVPRYGFVAMAGFAPLVAWLAQGFNRGFLFAACGVCLLLGSRQVGELSHSLRQLDESRLELLSVIQESAADGPVVFMDRIDHFPMQRLVGSQMTANWFLLDFENEDVDDPTALRIVQRDVARVFQEWYPDYQIIPYSRLRQHERFLLVRYRDPDKPLDEFPGYERRALLEGRVLEMTKSESEIRSPVSPGNDKRNSRAELATRPKHD